MVRQIERITRTEGERAPWSLLPKGLTYLTHQLMILIDCFVFSAKGAGCDSPAQRAGCAGHLVSSAESAKWFTVRRKLRHGESGAKQMPRLQRSHKLMGILTRAVGPGYYIPRLRRFAQTEPVQGRT